MTSQAPATIARAPGSTAGTPTVKGKAAQGHPALAAAFAFPGGGATLLVPWILALRVAGLVRGDPLWIRSPLDIPIGAFLACALVAAVFSPMRTVAFGSWALAVILFAVVFQAVLRMLNERPAAVRSIHRAMAVGSLCAAVYGLAVFYFQHPDRVQLPHLGGNALGFGLMVGIFFAVPLLGEAGPWRYLAALCIGAAAAALFGTMSRGALYGLAGGSVTYVCLVRDPAARRRFVLAVVLLAVGGFVVLSTHQLTRKLAYNMDFRGARSFSTVVPHALQFVTSEVGNDDRVPVWKASVAIIRAHPWAGIGMGVFPFVVHQWDSNIRFGANAHDIYLNVAAETGIPGALAFAAIPVMAFIYGLRRRDGFRAAQLAALAGMLCAEVRDTILMGFHMGIGLALLAALLVIQSGPQDAA
jgi:O-antigen ligase